MNDSDEEFLKTLSEIIVNTIPEVEKAFEEISEQGYDTKAIAFAYKKESLDHVSFLMANWGNVRPLLEKYATGNLAPIEII